MTGEPHGPRVPTAILVGTFLFNLGQGVLRPSLPLYLQHAFAVSYQQVTLIPVVFGAGKWLVSLPTGSLLDALGRRRLMVSGLCVIAASDLASVMAPVYRAFLGMRAVAGMGWAMFATVSITVIVDRPGPGHRGRAIGWLLMSETLGLLLGSIAGGWLYQRVGTASPFVFEAACMLMAAVAVGSRGVPSSKGRPASMSITRDWRLVRSIVRTPGVLVATATNAALMAVQTGVVVFLFPLYLLGRGGLSPQTVGYVVGVSVVGRLVALWLASGISDRRDRMSTLGFGLLGYGAVLASLGLVSDPLLLGLWSLMIGAGAGFVAGLPTAIIGDRVDPALHGIAIGWLRTVTDTGMLVGPLVMGPLADALDLTAPFVCAGVVVWALAWWCQRERVAVAVES